MKISHRTFNLIYTNFQQLLRLKEYWTFKVSTWEADKSRSQWVQDQPQLPPRTLFQKQQSKLPSTCACKQGSIEWTQELLTLATSGKAGEAALRDRNANILIPWAMSDFQTRNSLSAKNPHPSLRDTQEVKQEGQTTLHPPGSRQELWESLLKNN